MATSDLGWWYWLATVVVLAEGLLGWPLGFMPVIALGVLQSAHFLVREQSARALSVQVRVTYLGLLLTGLWAPLGFIHWLLLAGTIVIVLFDYCALARVLSLLPWNRHEALNLRLVARTFLTPPVKGSILQALSDS